MAKILKVNDLVPDSVMLKIANRIANSARQFARKTKSKRIPKSIKVGTVSSTEKTASITIWADTDIAPQAVVFERGAEPHGIDAKNFPYLRFPGTNQFAGQGIQVEHVDHPGMAKRPYMQPAKDKHRKRNLEELRESVGRNMRLQIRLMSKKV